MTSSMPWEGNATLNLSLDKAKEFTLKLRLPAWAVGNNSLKVNGEAYSATAGEDGYVAITRTWKQGDVININFPMSVQYVRNGDVIPTNNGLVAITRGPITYCVEQQDSVTELDLIRINEEYSTFSPEVVTDFVYDNTYNTAELQVLNVDSKDIYDNDISFRMIPYYAWSNRGKDAMKVYLSDGSQPRDSWDSDKSIAGNAKPSATATTDYSPVTNLNDGDRNHGSRWASWLSGLPDASKNPIVTYDFGQNLVKLWSTNIYFYSDGGGCQLPETVDIEYWNGTDWVDVALTNNPTEVLQPDYSNSNNASQQVYLVTYTFEEITTNKIRVKPSSSDSAIAITEWELTGARVKTTATVTAPKALELLTNGIVDGTGTSEGKQTTAVYLLAEYDTPMYAGGQTANPQKIILDNGGVATVVSRTFYVMSKSNYDKLENKDDFGKVDTIKGVQKVTSTGQQLSKYWRKSPINGTNNATVSFGICVKNIKSNQKDSAFAVRAKLEYRFGDSGEVHTVYSDVQTSDNFSAQGAYDILKAKGEQPSLWFNTDYDDGETNGDDFFG